MSSIPKLAQRLTKIQPFHVMRLLEKAQSLQAQGYPLIHMEVGEPDFPTPEPILKAGQLALAQQKTFYTPAIGTVVLREAIARFYEHRHGLSISPERIVVTPGASGALLLACSLLVNPNETLMMTDPGYPCNRHFLRLLGADAQEIPVSAATDFQLTAKNVQDNWSDQTAGVLLASPANPTGTVLSKKQLTELSTEIKQRSGFLIVDEIYQGLTYDGDVPTVLSVNNEAFVINSFSKYFGMTGWRLGWMVAPESVVPELNKLAQNIFLAPSTLAQEAALSAFSPQTLEILEERRAIFQTRRDFLLPELRNLGFQISYTPQGAFYLYANAGTFTDDGLNFVERLLDQQHVAITPGIDFGHHQADTYVRFSYTTELTKLEQAVERLTVFLRGL